MVFPEQPKKTNLPPRVGKVEMSSHLVRAENVDDLLGEFRDRLAEHGAEVTPGFYVVSLKRMPESEGFIFGDIRKRPGAFDDQA